MTTAPTAFETDVAALLEPVLCDGEVLVAYPQGRHAEFQAHPGKVTAILPIYNGEARLLRCLESIAAQTFTDYQAIIVDNCSTDRSFAIACRFAAEHPRFIVYQNPNNMGRVGNWNRGLALAMGDYLKPVMVNDFLLPDCLARLSSILDLNESVVMARGSVTTLENGEQHFGPLFESSRRLTGQEAIEYGVTTGNPSAGPTAQMFRRSAIESHALQFDTAYAWAADFEFAMRLFERGDMYYLREPLFVFEVTNRFAARSKVCDQLRDEIDVVGSSVTRYESRLGLDIISRARAHAESLYQFHLGKCVSKEETAGCESIWHEACARYPLLFPCTDEEHAGGANLGETSGPVHRVRRQSAPETVNPRWDSAVPEEVNFWEKWCRTQGGDWKDEFEFRLRPDSALQDYIIQFLNTPPGGTLRLLDVGAGPLTDLGKRWPGRKVELTAVDPLGDHYNAILRRHGLTAPVPTAAIGAEALTGSFQLNHFDMVYARNSIDHSLDAPQAIDQMLAVLKPGGVMFMAHFISEATAAGNTGLHGWNFLAQDGDFIVEKYGGAQVNITRRYAGIAQITCGPIPEKRWITVLAKKLFPSVAEDADSTPTELNGTASGSPSQAELAQLLADVKTAQATLDRVRQILDRSQRPQTPVKRALMPSSSTASATASVKASKPAHCRTESLEELRARADLCLRASNWKEAGKYYQALRNQFPDDFEVWQKSLECASRQGFKVLADIILTDALRGHPEWRGFLAEPSGESSPRNELAAVCS
jgi:glycosyltransferase involved in cell wall biosynthesis/SAM-dependent methyltransferase